MLFAEYLHAGTTTAIISGAVNSTNTLFTLPITPNALQMYVSGVLQLDGALGLTPYDFTWTVGGVGTSTATITFQASSTPQSNNTLAAWVWTLIP